MVKTARHNGAVDKHAYLVAQSITEHLLHGMGVMLKVGPLEHVVVLKKQVVRKLPAVMALHPRTRLMLSHEPQDGLVHKVVATLVPEAQHHNAATAGSLLGKGHHLVYILPEIGFAVALMRVERDLQLVRQRFEHVSTLRHQRAVGRDYRHEAFLTRHQHKLWQQRMKERFAHEMKIKKLHLAHKTGGQGVKLFHGHRVLGPRGLWTKHTVEVAHIGYLKIASGYHIGCFCCMIGC